jgi:hypothetical protein
MNDKTINEIMLATRKKAPTNVVFVPPEVVGGMTSVRKCRPRVEYPSIVPIKLIGKNEKSP